MQAINDRLTKLGITLPDPSFPEADFVPYLVTGNYVYISGQVCRQNGKLSHKGKLGIDHDIEAGKQAARVSALNVLSQLNQACGGDLGRVKRCVKVAVFVNSAPDFTYQFDVANGASQLFVEVFGEKGKHARSAIGVASLPFRTAVEVEAIFELVQ